MGLNPPPAILVKPEDALSSVRSAILLGAVVPELREQTEILIADLAELSRVAASIEAERAAADRRGRRAAGREAAARPAARRKAAAAGRARSRAAAEQQRSEELAGKARSLKDLIAVAGKAGRPQDARRRAWRAAPKQAERDCRAGRASPRCRRATGSTASAPFSALQGAGRAAGHRPDQAAVSAADDGNGGVMLGDMVATQSGSHRHRAVPTGTCFMRGRSAPMVNS